MKLQDMKIGTRLELNLGVILLLVVLFGATVYVFSNQLWQNTKTLYDHPLVVSQASRDIKANIIAMHRTMKDLVLYKTPDEIQKAMASIVQTELKTKENIGWVAHWLMKEHELKPFCESLLNILLNKPGAQIIAIYLLDQERLMFEHYDSIGLSSEKIKPFSARLKEGEFGAAINDKNIIHIKNIPDNTSFTFSVVTGKFIPKEIITIPILDKNDVTALISLASLHAFSPQTLQLIRDIWITLTARINGVMAFQKIHDFSVLLNEKTKELEAQSKELTLQTNELNENNIELEMTGIGIDADHLSFIFDEFRQVDEKTSRKYGGTGLGLAIAKKYSILIRGSIDVISRPGEGSTFIFKIPLKPDEKYTPTSLQDLYRGTDSFIPRSSSLNESDKKTILIVEDSQAQIIQHISSEELSFLKGNNVYQLIQKGSSGRKEILATIYNTVSKQPGKNI